MEPIALTSVDYRRLTAVCMSEASRREDVDEETASYYYQLGQKLSWLGSGAAEAEARRDRFNGRNLSHTQ